MQISVKYTGQKVFCRQTQVQVILEVGKHHRIFLMLVLIWISVLGVFALAENPQPLHFFP